MKELGSAIINAMAGVVACAIAGCIILDIKWLVTSKRQMAKILEELAGLKLNVSVLFKLQGPQMLGIKATLEAQRDGECNGNVTDALFAIEEAKKLHDNHLMQLLEPKKETLP